MLYQVHKRCCLIKKQEREGFLIFQAVDDQAAA